MERSQLAHRKSAVCTSNRKDCPAPIRPICPHGNSLLFNNEASHLAPSSDTLVDGELFSGSSYIRLKDRGQELVGELNSCNMAALPSPVVRAQGIACLLEALPGLRAATSWEGSMRRAPIAPTEHRSCPCLQSRLIHRSMTRLSTSVPGRCSEPSEIQCNCDIFLRLKSAVCTSNRKDCPAPIHPICPHGNRLLFNNEASHLAPSSDILADGELFSGSYHTASV
jgi:hypothetical protein